jgi:coenzyme PQQ precursor peptide PqqA
MDGTGIAPGPHPDEWETPDFVEIPTGCEVTAYVARWEE